MLSRIYPYIPVVGNIQAKREAEAKRRADAEREQLEVAQALELWLQSDIGVQFQKYIQADLDKTYQTLATTEASQVEEMRTLQSKVFALRMIQHYIARTLVALKKAEAAQTLHS